jgi:NADPH-dependent 2,4-dienoyl-CoA reductase/sulfur reductase-like enzyme
MSDVIVIGSGPAGLAAATELRKLGASVVLLEREGVAGGIPRHCAHSPFGMREFGRILSGAAYTSRLTERAVSAGVDIRLRHSVTAINGTTVDVASPDGIATLTARRVVIATGIRETSRAGRLVTGTRPLGILTTGALQDYVHLRHLAPFRRPVIVGSELVTMSAILTCRSGGISPLAIIEDEAGPRVGYPLAAFPHPGPLSNRHRRHHRHDACRSYPSPARRRHHSHTGVRRCSIHRAVHTGIVTGPSCRCCHRQDHRRSHSRGNGRHHQ